MNYFPVTTSMCLHFIYFIDSVHAETYIIQEARHLYFSYSQNSNI